MAAEDFIITKKRKKYKFARFAESTNCYELSEFIIQKRDNIANNSELVVELGAGTGLFLVETASRFPDKTFIAIDVKADRLFAGAKEAIAREINNIVFVRAHITQLNEILPAASVDEFWLTFSDPYPKKRHSKHRLTHSKFLQIYRNTLKAGGVLHFKTDNLPLFHWSLEQFIGAKCQLYNLTFDLHESKLPDEFKIMTSYEKRFVSEGLPIYCVDVTFDAASC